MSGIKYEVLTGDALLSALRGGRTGDLLEDAAYAAADEIERLREQLRLCNIDQCNTEARLAEAERRIAIALIAIKTGMPEYNMGDVIDILTGADAAEEPKP
jgi:hypothetical protein